MYFILLLLLKIILQFLRLPHKYIYVYTGLFRFTRNILPYDSINTHSSSGRVDGPLLETHSLLTCHQPRSSQVLSFSTKYFSFTHQLLLIRKFIYTYTLERIFPCSWLLSNVLRNYII